MKKVDTKDKALKKRIALAKKVENYRNRFYRHVEKKFGEKALRCLEVQTHDIEVLPITWRHENIPIDDQLKLILNTIVLKDGGVALGRLEFCQNPTMEDIESKSLYIGKYLGVTCIFKLINFTKDNPMFSLNYPDELMVGIIANLYTSKLNATIEKEVGKLDQYIEQIYISSKNNIPIPISLAYTRDTVIINNRKRTSLFVVNITKKGVATINKTTGDEVLHDSYSTLCLHQIGFLINPK